MRVSTGSKPKADQMPSKNGPYAAMVLHTARYQQVYKTPEVPVSTIDLEKALSLQKVSAKAHAVQWTKSMFANGLDMLGACVALRLGQMVLRILGVVLDHHLVTRDLGHDGRRGDAGDFGIALHHIALVRNGAQGVTIHEDAVGLKSRIGHGARNGSTDSTGHAHFIDILRRDMAKTDCRRHLGNLH